LPNLTAVRVEGAAEAPHPGACNFFAPDFALATSQPWFYGEPAPLPSAEPLPPILHRAEPSSADFAQMCEGILARIKAGEFEKVVPIVCEDLEFARPLRAGMFAATWNATPTGRYAYGIEHGGAGMAGVTPELLFEVRDGHLSTMALAGTGPADGPSLLEDPKERHEHGLVIQHIVGELRPWGHADVGETCERIYGEIKHLHTPISLRLQEPPDFMRLIVKLHPTAALGGWPRRPAIEWLEAQDFHAPRARFGAPFGFVHGGHMLCVVAIRCLQWWGSRARLAAGCGIVAESRPLREWNELQLKRRAAARALGLVE
jgi:menaquinone-specific isochorismate synthase